MNRETARVLRDNPELMNAFINGTGIETYRDGEWVDLDNPDNIILFNDGVYRKKCKTHHFTLVVTEEQLFGLYAAMNLTENEFKKVAKSAAGQTGNLDMYANSRISNFYTEVWKPVIEETGIHDMMMEISNREKSK